MEEIWREIPEYEGHYLISNLGNVMTNYSGEWKNKSLHISGNTKYVYVDLYLNGKSKKLPVHRLVALQFVDGYFDGAEVNHKDLNKGNNSFDNLEWTTRSENQNHQYCSRHPEYKKPICARCGNTISSKNSKMCARCRSEVTRLSNWPTREQFVYDLMNYNFTEIGRKYGRSDNWARKVAKSYDLPFTKRDVEVYKLEYGA